MSSTIGYRSTALPTHKAKAKLRAALNRNRLKRRRLEAKLLRKHGVAVEQQST